jgi:hypothetical protein
MSAGDVFCDELDVGGGAPSAAPLSTSFFGLLVAVVNARKPAITSSEPT